ncbi:MAG: oxidoreductase-like domain-containing protein [Burkholderiaceae bacterium]
MNDDLPTLLPSSAFQAKQWIADLSVQLATKGIQLREPPEEPTSCCGRGCNGCVWEGYMSAVGYWCEQARAALLKHP